MGDEDVRPPRSRFMRWMVIAWVIVLFLVGLYFLYRQILSRKIQARLEAIRGAGYPVTLEELARWYPEVPDVENAAHVYQQAFAHYRRWRDEKERKLPGFGFVAMPPRGEPPPADVKKLIVEYLDANRKALDLLHQAGEFRRCRYAVDFRDVQLHHLKQVRQGGRLLQLEALRQADKGDFESATRAVLSLLSLARSLAKEPFMSSYLWRISYASMSVHSIEWTLDRSELTDRQLSTLGASLVEAGDPDGLSRGLAGDACLCVRFFDSPSDVMREMDLEELESERALLPVCRLLGLLDRDRLDYLGVMAGYTRVGEQPLPLRNREAASVRGGAGYVSQYRRYRDVISRNVLLGIDMSVRAIARVRVGTVALAVERFRLADHALPEGLDELVPRYLGQLPSDPLDGKPLRYRRLARGYVVYSVGSDLADNGGTEDDRDRASDITFTVER